MSNPKHSRNSSSVRRTALSSFWLGVLSLTGSVTVGQELFDLDRHHVLTQNSLLLFGTFGESLDYFGFALASGDFDCDGFDDLAISSPFESIPKVPAQPALGDIVGAGVVHVVYGGVGGLTPTFFNVQQIEERDVGGVSESFDTMGRALAAGDLDGDTCDDLVIGIENQDQDGVVDSGSFIVVYGSPSGLDEEDNQLFHQNQVSVLGFAEPGDRFGSAFAVGNFDGAGPLDLAVSARGEGIGPAPSDDDEGAVWLFEGSFDGLLSGVNRPGWTDFFSQGTTGVADQDEPGDAFGTALAACDLDGDLIDDLIVGVPGEDEEFVESRGGLVLAERAGMVQTFYGSTTGIDLSDGRNATRLGTQAHGQYGFSLSAGRLEASYPCSIAASSPFVDLLLLEEGLQENAGRIEMWNVSSGSVDGFANLTQLSFPTSSPPEDDDVFGWTTATGDFSGDGFDDLVIGVWAEDFLDPNDGFLQIVPGTGAPFPPANVVGLMRNQLPAPSGFLAASAQLGWSLAVGDFDGDGVDDLAAGAPGTKLDGDPVEDLVGAVHVLYGISAGRIFQDGFESGSTASWGATVP